MSKLSEVEGLAKAAASSIELANYYEDTPDYVPIHPDIILKLLAVLSGAQGYFLCGEPETEVIEALKALEEDQ